MWTDSEYRSMKRFLVFLLTLAGLGLVALVGAICYGLWFLVARLQWVG